MLVNLPPLPALTIAMSTATDSMPREVRVRMCDPDARLFERLRDDEDGDAALAALVERFQHELVGYFYNQCWRQDVAEELAQTVFIKIYQARARYQADAKARTYLYRIAYHAWIDHVRHRARQRAVSLEQPLGSGSTTLGETLPAPSELDVDEQRHLRHRIEQAVQALPESQRSVFVLANNHDLKYQDIAEILAIPEGTVKSRMYHAVRRLRDSLQDLIA
ncbi:MAG: RNA polymerase sigma factor [Planctomycetota bacterium]